MDMLLRLDQQQAQRLEQLGGKPWLEDLIARVLSAPQVDHPRNARGDAAVVQHVLQQDPRIAEETSQILANTSHLRALFCGGSKVVGNAGELAYEALLRSAFPKVDFVKVSNDGRSGDIRADFADNFRVLIEVKTRANNVPKAEVEAFQSSMRAQRQHGILLNAKGGIVHRPHRINLEIIPAEDRQLAAVYLPGNAGDMDTVGLALNLLRKVGPLLDASQGQELVFSADVFDQVNQIVRRKAGAMREAQQANRAMAALAEKQARQLETAFLDDLSATFASACARVKVLSPTQLPLRLTLADIPMTDTPPVSRSHRSH